MLLLFSRVIKEPVDKKEHNSAQLCAVNHSAGVNPFCGTVFSYTGHPPHGTFAQMAFRAALSSISLTHLHISCTFNSVTFNLLSIY